MHSIKMKSNKKILWSVLGVVIAIIILITAIFINNKIIEEKYMTKGDYYIYFFNEQGGFDFDEEELEEKIQNDTGEFTKEVAYEVYDNWYIEKEQLEDLDEPVTREIVAQTLVRAMEFRTEHNIKIKDIDKCVDKQAIIDAVGMKLFELSNDKFKPNDYMTKEEVEEAYEKMSEIEMNSSYPNSLIERESLQITLNGIEYEINKDLKVSNFVNNGWKATNGKELLYKTNKQVEDLIDDSNYGVGFNAITFEQKNVELVIYFDTSSLDSKVINSNIIAITMWEKDNKKDSEVEFLGLQFGSKMTEKQFKNIFGNINFEISETDKNINYSSAILVNNQDYVYLNLITDKKDDILIYLDLQIK